MKLYGDNTPSPHHNGAKPQAASDRLVWEPMDLPADLVLLRQSSSRRGFQACGYLALRGFDPGELQSLGYLWWEEQRRIVIPYFNESDETIFIAAHSPFGEKPKYVYPKGPKPLYIPHRDAPGTVVIVEGQFDAARVLEAGYCAVGIGGSYLAPHVEQDLVEFVGARECVIMLDGDATKQAMRLQKQLYNLGMSPTVRLLDKNDDPAMLSVEQVQEKLT